MYISYVILSYCLQVYINTSIQSTQSIIQRSYIYIKDAVLLASPQDLLGGCNALLCQPNITVSNQPTGSIRYGSIGSIVVYFILFHRISLCRTVGPYDCFCGLLIKVIGTQSLVCSGSWLRTQTSAGYHADSANHEWSIVQNYRPKKWIVYDCFIPNVTTSVGPSPPLRLMHTQEGSTDHIFNWGLQAGNCHALRLLFSLAIQSN